MENGATRRLSELDGLRGWAALCVVLFHIFWESFGQLFPQYRSVFIAGFLNGKLSVCIFFVVSGAALSAPYFAEFDRKAILISAVKRYPRLTFPIFIATLITVVVGYLGLIHGSEASALLQRTDWGGLNNSAELSIKKLIRFSLIDVYTGPVSKEDILPFLWTMPIEMMGSFLLFLYLSLYDIVAKPLRLLAAITCFTFIIYPFASCFFAGAFLTAHRARGASWPIFERGPAAIAILLLALAISTITARHPAFFGVDNINTIVAISVCFITINNKRVNHYFGDLKISRFLGKISFPIYLMHYLVLNTALSWLVLRTGAALSFSQSFGIGCISLIVSILLSIAFQPVEKFGHVISGKIANVILQKKTSFSKISEVSSSISINNGTDEQKYRQKILVKNA